MAFRSNVATQNNTAAPSNDSWKASGFVNFYLPSTDGGKRKKFGAIALRDSKPAEAALIQWLKEDPANIAKLLSKIEIDFQSVEASNAIGFALD